MAVRCLWALAVLGLAAAGCKCRSEEGGVDSGAVALDAGGGAAEAKVPEPVKWLRDADSAFQHADQDTAMQKAKAVIERQPGNAVAYNLLGRAAAAKFDTSRDPKLAAEATAAFNKAFEVNPSFWPAMQNLAELEHKQGHKREAADLYRRILALQPNHPEKARWQQLISEAGGAPAPEGKK
jgi:tetratricopeptide (TPR) repeat protein